MNNNSEMGNVNSRRFTYSVNGKEYSVDVYLPGFNETIEKSYNQKAVEMFAENPIKEDMKKRGLEGEYVFLGHYACVDKY